MPIPFCLQGVRVFFEGSFVIYLYTHVFRTFLYSIKMFSIASFSELWLTWWLKWLGWLWLQSSCILKQDIVLSSNHWFSTVFYSYYKVLLWLMKAVSFPNCSTYRDHSGLVLCSKKSQQWSLFNRVVSVDLCTTPCSLLKKSNKWFPTLTWKERSIKKPQQPYLTDGTFQDIQFA